MAIAGHAESFATLQSVLSHRPTRKGVCSYNTLSCHDR